MAPKGGTGQTAGAGRRKSGRQGRRGRGSDNPNAEFCAAVQAAK